jgi:threonine dehydrogenase-like Zn-dependent dehydrogenase
MTGNPSLRLPRALWIVGPGRAEIRTESLPPPPGPETVRVRALQSGISRGTESLVFAGKVPESEHERMRCPFQAGAFSFPVKYGYAMVGVVEDGAGSLVGQRVFALHPHQDRFTIALSAVVPVPESLPTKRAVLAPQIETALNACWDAGPRLGDRIAVIGAGTIGCLVAWLCVRLPGADVTLIDHDPSRAAIAAALGVPFAAPGGAQGGRDLVFHTSGSSSGLAHAISLAGFEAEVLELSWYGDNVVTAPLGGAFHSQRLTLRSSQVGAVAPARRARWDYTRRLGLALALADDPCLDVLVQEATPFESLPDALPGILGRPGALMHRVLYAPE